MSAVIWSLALINHKYSPSLRGGTTKQSPEKRFYHEIAAVTLFPRKDKSC